ncbi:hypothetical protein ACXYMO_15250 [Arenibacterium sp. CAU 1754]
MAYTATHTAGAAIEPGVFKRFLTAMWDGLVRIGENSTIMRQVDALNAMSDDELAARGLTRQQVLHRIFAGRLYI